MGCPKTKRLPVKSRSYMATTYLTRPVFLEPKRIFFVFAFGLKMVQQADLDEILFLPGLPGIFSSLLLPVSSLLRGSSDFDSPLISS